MDKIAKVKSISVWVFIIPFISLNACLILITQFHGLFPNQEHVINKCCLGCRVDHATMLSRCHELCEWIMLSKS